MEKSDESLELISDGIVEKPVNSIHDEMLIDENCSVGEVLGKLDPQVDVGNGSVISEIDVGDSSALGGSEDKPWELDGVSSEKGESVVEDKEDSIGEKLEVNSSVANPMNSVEDKEDLVIEKDEDDEFVKDSVNLYQSWPSKDGIFVKSKEDIVCEKDKDGGEAYVKEDFRSGSEDSVAARAGSMSPPQLDGDVVSGVSDSAEGKLISSAASDKQTSVESPLMDQVESTSPDQEVSKPKGFGLRKWRRIRRDVVRDSASSHELQRALKRELSNCDSNMGPPPPSSQGNRKGGNLSPVSMNSLDTIMPIDELVADPEFADGAFTLGAADSDSGDQSSKSSTAASVPKVKKGSRTEKLKGKSSARHGSHSRRKSWDDGLKKIRGDSADTHPGQYDEGSLENHVEGEGSSKVDPEPNIQAEAYSSAESDSRSTRRLGSVDTNSITSKAGKFVNNSNGSWRLDAQDVGSSLFNGHAGRNDDHSSGEVQGGGQTGELSTSSYQDNGDGYGGEVCKDLFGDTVGSQYQDTQEGNGNSENVTIDSNSLKNADNPHHTEKDLWIESLAQLQAAQEALGKEIKKVGVIRQELYSLPGISIHKRTVSMPAAVGIVDSTSLSEVVPSVLGKRVIFLETELEKALETISSQAALVEKLKTDVKTANFASEKAKDDLQLLNKKYKEMDSDMDHLMQQSIEDAVKYLVVKRAAYQLEILPEDQSAFLKMKESLVEEQQEILRKVRDADRRALLVKRRAEELKDKLVGTVTTENSARKLIGYSLVQFIMICIAIQFFILQLSPQSPGVVPT